ncbi:hypothetical protein MKZ38_001884 [Zalerion maritima]|uniref:Major facilitator superfamily (MFS) profile domain-containing protein n=1 Tax=Zalerion maritima TaxID=339359 RepID=A0AAD5RQP3_9PEZI|nr:hypothetical protein MKZ38_001884 [Zalerion maritima]
MDSSKPCRDREPPTPIFAGPEDAASGSDTSGSGNAKHRGHMEVESPPTPTSLAATHGDSPFIAPGQHQSSQPGRAPPAAAKKNGPQYTAFPVYRQNTILGLVTAAGFLGPLAGGIYLPALPVLETDFHVSATAINATVSVFMVVFAIGPLFWSSFADYKGRRPLYLISLAIYIIANILLAAVPTDFAALAVLRAVQAFGAAAAVAMGAGSVADVTPPAKRATAMSYFLLGPQCGPILGPVFGGLLAGEAHWRWIFAFLAILAFVVWLLIMILLPETLRARVGNGEMYSSLRGLGKVLILPPTLFSKLAPEDKRGPPPPKPSLKMYWGLLSYLPIFIVTMNTALLYSTYFCISVILPTALAEVYGWSTTAVGFGFLAVGIAMVVGSLGGGRFSDWRRKRLVMKMEAAVKDDGGEKQFDSSVSSSSDTQPHLEKPRPQPVPETRLGDQIWGVVVCATGCILFGWFVHFKIHPAAVLVATFVNGFGMSSVFITTTAFLTEAVPKQAALSFALGNMLRNPGAAISAVLAPTLVKKMGWGWCFTGLGLLDLVLVGGAVVWLRVGGTTWRERRKEQERKGGRK